MSSSVLWPWRLTSLFIYLNLEVSRNCCSLGHLVKLCLHITSWEKQIAMFWSPNETRTPLIKHVAKQLVKIIIKLVDIESVISFRLRSVLENIKSEKLIYKTARLFIMKTMLQPSLSIFAMFFKECRVLKTGFSDIQYKYSNSLHCMQLLECGQNRLSKLPCIMHDKRVWHSKM